jgi:hypothetical protein
VKLDPRNLERLVKLLGMLGSDHDGERAAAAAKASELVRAHGLTWLDVIPTAPTSYRHEHTKRSNGDAGADWRTMRDFCAQRSSLLRSREQEFIDDINGWHGALTPKQSDWLIAIYTRVKKLAT